MADMIKPFSVEVVKDDKKDDKLTADFSFFRTEDAKISTPLGSLDTVDEPKKRGRPKKSNSVADVVVPADNSNGNLPLTQTNEPYSNAYNETTYMLKTAIHQVDTLESEVKSDIDAIRASKTLKNKYNYITEMTGTMSSLLGTKISAIREINSSITNANKLDLQRIKELKSTGQEKDDDKAIMDMYSAFINTPVGMYGNSNPLGPPIQDMLFAGGGNSGLISADIVPDGGMGVIDAGMSQYLNNLSPEQNRMRLDNNPNIQTVVVFNQDTGQRYFDVIDKATGASVPNYTRPDAFLLENTTIDVNHGIARNTDIDQTYGLILTGSGGSAINEY